MVFLYFIDYNHHWIYSKKGQSILTSSLKSQFYRLLIIISIPGILVTFLALWAEREAAIEKSEEKVVNIAKHLTHQQTAMIGETEQLTRFLANTIATEPNLPGTCPGYFYQLQELYTNVANIGVVDDKGNLICVTNGIVKNVSISDRQYFKNAIANKSFSIGYFQYDRSIQAPSVNFAHPIIDKQEQLKGVVVTVHCNNNAL